MSFLFYKMMIGIKDTGYGIRDTGCGIRLMALLFFFPLLLFSQVRMGAERTDAYFPLLKGKRIGVVANNASVVGDVNIFDFLVQKGFNVTLIFSPEHGFRMNAGAGETTANEIDSATGIRVVSLYGKQNKPDAADLKALDIVLFDIQDVGVRFYTYISTLTYVMEACAENKTPLIVLDRSNPNGFYIDGPVLEKEYTSFVGLHPVPVVYGMTIGEYACMVNGEGWLKNHVKCDLKVIRLTNYSHDTRCELPVKPSPNLPNLNAVYLYPSLCFFEGTIVSVGRGTSFPFEVIGHPDLKPGPFKFTPQSIPGTSLHPPFEGKECHGIDLRGYLLKHPGQQGKINLSWLMDAYRNLNHDPVFFTGYFNKLAGNATLQQQIKSGKSAMEIRESWEKDINRFRKIREKYLMY